MFMEMARRDLLRGLGIAIASSLVPDMVRCMPEGQYKATITSLFWVGEPPTRDNNSISNYESYWDKTWQARFGGVDHPGRRQGYWPAAFKPRENPFYVALPYGEFLRGAQLKSSVKDIPWHRPDLSPLLKNHWVEVLWRGRSCFAQWEDVGPLRDDDFGFVFGDATRPINSFGVKAGLDISPAVWTYLGLTDNAFTAWRFVDAALVPRGPWTEIITTSGNNR